MKIQANETKFHEFANKHGGHCPPAFTWLRQYWLWLKEGKTIHTCGFKMKMNKSRTKILCWKD